MRSRVLWLFVIFASALVVFAIMFMAAVPLSSDTLRHRLIAGLSWRLDSDVELADLHVRVFPGLHAEGTGLVIRRHGQTNMPPLITVKSFTVDTGVVALWRKHVTHAGLEGLEIQIPPSHDDDRDGSSARTTDSSTPDMSLNGGVVIDTLDSSSARLLLIPKERDREPKLWSIHALRMHNVGIDQAMPYTATLADGVPPGDIQTTGHFGPWQREDPGRTPLDGVFTFNHADLSVFPGIAGILSSRGAFGGTLGRLDVNGETNTPDFTIKVSGRPFPMSAKYHAIVDGTNGDTRLERIDARLINSSLVAKGAVLAAPKGGHGRTVTLDVVMDQARIEDIMRMVVKDPKPPMTGGLKLTTKFLLPPGENDVVERLKLEGRFRIATARFTNYNVQAKIDELSHRSRGQDEEKWKEGVVSNFEGRFKLDRGKLMLPDFKFSTPGTTVQLAGAYAIKPETLDFRGTVLMDAKISQTQHGIKSLLLKAVDPLFRRPDGSSGSAIPIKIAGKRDDPAFGLDVRRVFRRGGS